MENPEKARLDAFFQQITTRFPADGAVTTRLLPERPAFLRAMAATSTVASVLPKPRSVDQPMLEQVHQHVHFRWSFRLRAQGEVMLQAEEVNGYEWRSVEDAASPTVRAQLALLPVPIRS
ncbi:MULTISPECIES: hypothetical protein [unclassified Streptomyces]|uniref:hypothetical protein n=1 Tax=unclassified Streptomyces TaxID=2593676 RepID=UPI0029675B80|nr:hypothetical protein [Streptomyces sp. SJL17-1]